MATWIKPKFNSELSKEFECPFCGFHVKFDLSYIRNIENQYVGEIPFYCPNTDCQSNVSRRMPIYISQKQTGRGDDYHINDLEIPKGLSKHGKKAAKIILSVLERNDMTYTGGCKTFYTPQEWKGLNEHFGLNSELIVVHDGGEVRNFFNYDCEDCDLVDEMNLALELEDLCPKQCESWYTAIYRRAI